MRIRIQMVNADGVETFHFFIEALTPPGAIDIYASRYELHRIINHPRGGKTAIMRRVGKE